MWEAGTFEEGPDESGMKFADGASFHFFCLYSYIPSNVFSSLPSPPLLLPLPLSLWAEQSPAPPGGLLSFHWVGESSEECFTPVGGEWGKLGRGSTAPTEPGWPLRIISSEEGEDYGVGRAGGGGAWGAQESRGGVGSQPRDDQTLAGLERWRKVTFSWPFSTAVSPDSSWLSSPDRRHQWVCVCVCLPNVDEGMRDFAGRFLPLTRVGRHSQNWREEEVSLQDVQLFFPQHFGFSALQNKPHISRLARRFLHS